MNFYRDLIFKLFSIFDHDMTDAILKMLPISLASTIMTVSWITCGGHGFIAGMLLYYIRVRNFSNFTLINFQVSLFTSLSFCVSYSPLTSYFLNRYSNSNIIFDRFVTSLKNVEVDCQRPTSPVQILTKCWLLVQRWQRPKWTLFIYTLPYFYYGPCVPYRICPARSCGTKIWNMILTHAKHFCSSKWTT